MAGRALHSSAGSGPRESPVHLEEKSRICWQAHPCKWLTDWTLGCPLLYQGVWVELIAPVTKEPNTCTEAEGQMLCTASVMRASAACLDASSLLLGARKRQNSTSSAQCSTQALTHSAEQTAPTQHDWVHRSPDVYTETVKINRAAHHCAAWQRGSWCGGRPLSMAALSGQRWMALLLPWESLLAG